MGLIVSEADNQSSFMPTRARLRVSGDGEEEKSGELVSGDDPPGRLGDIIRSADTPSEPETFSSTPQKRKYTRRQRPMPTAIITSTACGAAPTRSLKFNHRT